MDFNSIFKAYDVRGIHPEQIDEAVAARIGEAYAAVISILTDSEI